jgi:glycosyltransferase involved in cell wall biosynthesis
MTENLVSVIIPCFNQGKYLPETVASVLSSEYSPLEIIIVNDGSKDNTEQVCEKLQTEHSCIKYLYQTNQGPSVARNHGIRESKGEYILPLDGDDLISPDYISEAVKVLESRPEVKLVYCQAEKFGAKTGLWKLKRFSLPALAKDNMIFVSGIYRKADWKKCGGYAEEMTWGYEDWEFWISMLKHGGEVVQLPFVGFHYRISPTSRRKGVKKAGKRKTVKFLNKKHKNFMYQHLDGPLRESRSTSKLTNRVLRLIGRLD